jgi:2',3'-cyclic-nucleotide 2'-phosphodiesterase (5'-nucleotidase family)
MWLQAANGFPEVVLMIRKALFPILASLLLAALGSATQAPTRITIMHTNDLHGQVVPRNGQGGLAEIAAIIRENNPDLILDAGDLFTGTYVDDQFEGQPTIQAMNAIGYTAGTIGNHEFDYGQTVLAARLRDAQFPLLSANLETSIPGMRPFTVKTVKGIRFGIIGLTTQELRTSTHPRNLDGIRVLEVVDTLKRFLPEIRRQTDFIIVTAHLTDEEERRVAGAFPEIRLIVGGHNHSALGPIHINQTLVAKTGNAGRNVGRVDLEFAGTRLSRIDARLIPVVLREPDRNIAALLEPFQSAVTPRLREVLGEATAALTRADDAESSLANLVADAYRAKAGTEIGLANIGGIRAPIARGPVTLGAVFEVFPFRDTLVTLKLTGAQLKTTLGTRLLAVSGIRVRYDLAKPAGSRLVSVTLADGTAVDDTTLYSIAVNDFMVAGGDGFGELARGTDTLDTHISIWDVMTDYVKSRRTLTPTLDGRVNVR